MGPPTMVGGTHMGPISLGLRKWEWYGDSMGIYKGLIGGPSKSHDVFSQCTLRLVKQL